MRRSDWAVKFFAYERDRGTMPVVRSNLAQSSILRKLIDYGATRRGGLHRAIYGLPNFRVLTEAPGPKRVENMITEGYQRHLSPLYPQGCSCLPSPAACLKPRTSSITNGSTAKGSDTV